MTHTLTTRSCYCRDCKKISHHYGVAFGDEPVKLPVLGCNTCGTTNGVELVVECAECGHELRESAALWSEDDGSYYCTDCRTACSVCGQAHNEEYMSVDEDGNLWCVYCEIDERIRLASAF